MNNTSALLGRAWVDSSDNSTKPHSLTMYGGSNNRGLKRHHRIHRELEQIREVKNRVKLNKSVFQNHRHFRETFNDFMAPRESDITSTQKK